MNIIYIIFAYLLGSIPTAYIYFKIKQNKDIRDHGSGNSGALNIWRSQNITSGTLVLIIDLIKAISIALTGKQLEVSEIGFYTGTVCSVLGHNYPIYLRFKGGKGVSVVAGITLMTITIPSFVAGITIAIVALITRSPLWGILLGALVLNVLTLIIEQSISLSIWCAIMSLIVGVTHFSRRKDELIPAIKNIDLKKIGQIE
ncbi:MAG: glycerol-3-phosphate acyltransferase [Dehalococcoidia bacterium]